MRISIDWRNLEMRCSSSFSKMSLASVTEKPNYSSRSAESDQYMLNVLQKGSGSSLANRTPQCRLSNFFPAGHAAGERVVRNLFQTRQPSKLPKIAAYTYTSVKLFFPARIQKKCRMASTATA